MEKTILVTGGVGFIGTNLCLKLLKEGHHIICLDNLSTGSIKNKEILSLYNNFEFIKHDITIPFFTDSHIDEIYNLACPASPKQYQTIPVETTITSVIGVYNMLELANKHNSKILQASTSEIYGNPQIHPQKESYFGYVNPNGPRSCYDEGKRCAESLLMDYNRKYGTKIKIVRIFNTYGPYMQPNDGRVISNFIIQALQGENITIYGDGSQTRSFQYIDDLIEGIVLMMRTDDSIKGPLNIGNPTEISIQSLASLILDKIKCKSQIVYTPLPQDDPCKRCPDISLSLKILQDWHPKIGIAEGLEKTINYFKKELS